MEHIVLAGGTGLIGGNLTDILLKEGYRVTILTRKNKQSSNQNLSYSEWEPATGKIARDIILTADHIINLSGENVAEKRWTTKRKNEILRSRVQSNELLTRTMRETKSQCKTFISASAIGWYGPDTKEAKEIGFHEDAPAYNDFLGATCKAWEASAEDAMKQNVRTVFLRTGIVLTQQGGALKEFLKPLSAGFATILGSGDQTISWIHIDDLCRMYLFALQNKIEGAFNAVAPKPVSNKQLIISLAERKRGKFYISVHVPSFAIKLMLGEMSIEVLKSTTVSADKIKNAGFQFLYPGIQSAIENLIRD